MCPDGSPPRDRVAEQRLRNILGLDERGEAHPLESYDIGCDEGSWNAFLRKVWCGAQAMPFALGKWAIGVGVEAMGWALEFRLADALTPVAGLLSRLYDTSLIGPLQLRDLAWTAALFVGGWHLMRARAARGISEIATTVLVAAVGGIVLANPQGYLEGSIDLAQNTSGAVLEAVSDVLANGDAGQDAGAVRSRLGGILRTSFVAEPHDLINWGHQLTGACAAARDQILADGPWGSDDEPRDIMRDHGCAAEAEFNADPSDQRAAASLVVGLAAVVATVLLLAVALVVFVAQLTLVALFAGASLVWALALFPNGRELLWWWIGRLVWAVAATIAATFALSWLAVTVTAVLSETSDLSIIQRSLVALLVVAFAFRLRAHLGRMIDQASRRFGDSISRVGRHAQSRWSGFAATGPSGGGGSGSGFGLSMTARSWAADTPGGQYMFNRLYARHFTRGYRQRGGPLRTTRRALGAARHGARSAGTASGQATRSLRRGARAVVMAPILGPQAVAATRVRATAASRRARARLHQARATRQQWAANVRHPVEALRTAQQRAAPGARQRVRPAAPGRRHVTSAAAGRPAVGGWWRVAGGSSQDQQLPFEQPGASYHQLTIDDFLPQRHSGQPQPGLRGRPAAQQRLGFPPLWHQPALDLHQAAPPPNGPNDEPRAGRETGTDDGS